LFAHHYTKPTRKLGASLELAEWRGGIVELENALFEHADCVTVTGSDETLTSLRQRLPLRARFVGYAIVSVSVTSPKTFCRD